LYVEDSTRDVFVGMDQVVASLSIISDCCIAKN